MAQRQLTQINKLRFIEGGGEMGKLTRSYHWEETSLGAPDQWPLSLHTTLGLLLHSAFPMFLFWGKDLICFYNDAYRPSLGQNGKHPAVGKKGKDVWPEIWDFIGPLIEKVMTTGEPEWFEDQLLPIYRNGLLEDVYWTFSYSAAYDDQGGISGVFVTCTETTSKVNTVKQLKESELRIRSVIDNAPFPIGVYSGKEMRIELVNQSILDVWGKGNDVVGKLYAEVLPELEEQQIYPQLDKVFVTGEPFHARDQRVDLVVDGKLQDYYFNYSFTPIYNTDKSIYGVMNTAAEVTDLHRAKLTVEQSEKNFRNMILQAPVAMCILMGHDHVIEIANELMIDLWGKPAGDVMNKPVFDALPDARQQGLEQLMEDVYHNGVTFKASERPVVLLRNGSTDTVYQNFVYEPYRDGDGSIIGILVVTIDVTDQVISRQKIEEVVAERTKELAEVNRNLEKSNAELAQFAYIASHDLQEPLRKVITFTQMLESEIGELSERSANYMEKIKASSKRMLTLVRDVLAYSELANIRTEYEAVDLNKIVKDVVTDFELLIEQKKANISVSGLPLIDAIPLHMSQLFGNLLSNALKYSKPGVNPEINITTTIVYRNDKYYHIEFSDNGIGFSQENASQIFNIFQRLHSRHEFEGTGIGLSMCQKIVQNHHGDIIAFSEPGVGSRFVITLPEKQQRSV